jgi:DNA replication protein DnaC
MFDEMKNTMSQMKFYGMLRGLDLRLTEAQEHGWSYTDFLASLILDEKDYRQQKSTEYKIRRAKFRIEASFDHFDFTVKRSIKKGQIAELKQLNFLRNKQNFLLLGPTGVGKTFIASAIGYHACQEGFNCIFMGMNLFIEQAAMNRACGTYLKFRDRLLRPDLLILDDLGIKPLDPSSIQDFYDILEERYQSKSTLITTQLPFKNWREVIPDDVALEAILDRLVHGQKVEITGESYRKKKEIDKIKGDH